MAANYSKFYLCYLNKLADEYNHTYHRSIGKNLIHTDYSVLTEVIESNHKIPNFKIGDRVRINKNKNIFSKSYKKKWSKEMIDDCD